MLKFKYSSYFGRTLCMKRIVFFDVSDNNDDDDDDYNNNTREDFSTIDCILFHSLHQTRLSVVVLFFLGKIYTISILIVSDMKLL